MTEMQKESRLTFKDLLFWCRKSATIVHAMIFVDCSVLSRQCYFNAWRVIVVLFNI